MASGKSKVLTVRTSIALHKKIAFKALEKGLTMNDAYNAAFKHWVSDSVIDASASRNTKNERTRNNERD